MPRPWRVHPAQVFYAVACAAMLTGCAGQGATQTGFMSSYDNMAPTQANTRDLIFVDPEYRRRLYRAVAIEPVAWYPAQGMPPRAPEVVAALQADFAESLAEQLGRDWALVPPAQSLAPGTLRVRAAITNTRKANWWINAPVQLAGIGLHVIGVPGGVPPPNPGGASVEMEVLDGATGKRLVAISTYNNGVPWAPVGYYRAYGHARRAFRNAAELLDEQLLTGSVVEAAK